VERRECRDSDVYELVNSSKKGYAQRVVDDEGKKSQRLENNRVFAMTITDA